MATLYLAAVLGALPSFNAASTLIPTHRSRPPMSVTRNARVASVALTSLMLATRSGLLSRKSFSATILIALVVALSMPLRAGAQAHGPLHVAGYDLEVVGDLRGFTLSSQTTEITEGVEVLALTLRSSQPAVPPKFALKWSIPSHGVAGHWMTGRGQTKGIRPDWSGGRLQASMLAREAPVSTLFANDDRNILTFALSDALNTISLGSGVREEDGLIYNEVIFFGERHEPLTEYTAALRVDRRPVRYEVSLHDVGEWWAAMPAYTPSSTPEAARLPVYSTWYNYHQNIDAAELLKEMAVAKQLGYRTIIVDDGWQTLDSGRGYAYTGDWQPERMPGMKAFIDASHKMNMKVMLWYAVPFMGKHAKAAERFKNQSLRFDDRLGAYVLDPRFPQVRQYLIDTYVRAAREWNIDGFKLDFIERFVADETTILDATNGRDYASVNAAADRLMTDVMAALRAINPDVMIEFRQAYIGPLIRKYGNMFRASDSPNAYLTNKVKTIDLRLLSGATAVHADMIMWHESEPVEMAAFQFTNILFSVPQLSVKLRQLPPDHFAMVKFHTDYWLANRDILLNARIEAPAPLANYPIVSARSREKQIIALYADMVARITNPTPRIDLVNAKGSRGIVFVADNDAGVFKYHILDCQGRSVRNGMLRLGRTPQQLDVPISGIVELTQ